jgi:hypothetical protein
MIHMGDALWSMTLAEYILRPQNIVGSGSEKVGQAWSLHNRPMTGACGREFQPYSVAEF